jgi:hypothetical protein
MKGEPNKDREKNPSLFRRRGIGTILACRLCRYGKRIFLQNMVVRKFFRLYIVVKNGLPQGQTA